ncbi:MAG: NAD(P)-dependent oxidoreductase, partial [Pseudohongiellaceae bacterium]
MDFLPLFLNIRGRRCLVVGGGEIARRKAELLCRAGATVCVVAPRVDEPLRKLVMSVNGECREREFRDSDLEGAVIVVAATNERKINRLVSEAAGRAGMPVNVVDQPELCSFIFPAVIDRSPVVLAVSSSGRSPVLVRQIKEQLETMIPGAIGSLADLLGSYRDEVKQRIGGFSSRVRFWERLLDSEVSELVYSGKEDEARQLVEQRLAQSGKES